MTTITATGMLSTFSSIRTIIRTDSTLGAKFSLRDFYEFEPKHKSPSFNGMPYIIINVPSADDADGYLGDYFRHKEFMIEIILRMEYMAKDNYSGYASRLLNILDSSNALFEAYGYHLVSVSADGSPTTLSIEQKEIIEGRFTLTLQGEVAV